MSREQDEQAWTDWCRLNDLDPWPTDHLVADPQLADWLFLNHRDRSVGYGRLKGLGSAVATGFADRGLEDPRGITVKRLRDAVADKVGMRTEQRKVDALTHEDIQTAVVAGFLASATPELRALRRSLGIELGHTHQVPTAMLRNISGDDLGERTVTIDGVEYAVDTDLEPLRSEHRIFGTVKQIEEVYEVLGGRVCFEITSEPTIAAGLTATQARWARFASNPKGVAALMWTAYVLSGNAWALRHNDLTRMDISGVAKRRDGVAFTIFGGKTLGDGVRREYEIGHDHTPDRVCAACALWSWTLWCRIGEGRTHGPLWVSREGAHSRVDKAISSVGASGALRRAINNTALADRRIATRSLRVGTSTEMAAAGESLAEIMAVTGHRSVSEALRYIRLLSPKFQPHLDI